MEILRPDKTPSIVMPTWHHNEHDRERQVGVELEFSGLTIDEILGRVADAVGGREEKHSNYEACLHDTSVGRVRVEFDALLFRDMKLKGFLDDLNLNRLQDDLGANVEDFMAGEARRVVPFEVVFEPLPIGRLGELEVVRAALRTGAEGTRTSLFNAFGLHLNPELPRVDTPTILCYLRAFLVLYEHLKDLHDVDPVRRISPFIDPFPREYVQLVLAESYQPDAATFTDDYLAHNATRNRPLDLLPVLAWMDEERVRAALPEEKISPRPALHYRLPNSQIDEADWSIVAEWNRWAEVENLAADESMLRAGMRTALVDMTSPLRRFLESFWK